MQRLWGYARQHTGRIGWGILMLLFTNVVTQALPQLMRFAIDGINEGASVDYLRELAMYMVVLAIAGVVFRTMSRVNIFFSARDVEMELRKDFYVHLTQQDASFFQDHPTGDLMSRATNDLGQVRLLVGPGILNVVNTTMGYAVAIPLMWMISSKLTIIILTVYPPALLMMRYLAKLLYVRNRAQQERMGEISSYVQENLAGAHVIRSFGLEAERADGFDGCNRANYLAAVRLALVRSGMFRLVMALAGATILVGLYMGAREVIDQNLSLGDVVAIIEYMALLTWPTFALGWVLSMWQRGSAAMSRLNEIFERQPIIVPGARDLRDLQPAIDVRSLTFEYEGHMVLREIDVVLKPGQTLGVVGPIGSGKSTFVKALMRLIDIDSGSVFLGGKDITELKLDSLRSHFGYVSQENVLFSRSLADNVAFGKPGASRDEVARALKQASLNYDDGTLPSGIETVVGERGITLSGGQKQRTAIARALLIEPPVLVLDDSLSSVDSDTEEAILEAVRRERREKTTIIVAHRMTAVAHADEIVVMEEGRITERGDHASLMAEQGLYAQMVRRQELMEGMQ